MSNTQYRSFVLSSRSAFCSNWKSTRLSTGDVRITAHVNENDLGDTLFSTLHEAGHAMYEQGVSAALDGTPLWNRRP